MKTRHLWMVRVAVAALTVMYLAAKLYYHPHRHLFSAPAHESLPMPRSTPDRG